MESEESDTVNDTACSWATLTRETIEPSESANGTAIERAVVTLSELSALDTTSSDWTTVFDAVAHACDSSGLGAAFARASAGHEHPTLALTKSSKAVKSTTEFCWSHISAPRVVQVAVKRTRGAFLFGFHEGAPCPVGMDTNHLWNGLETNLQTPAGSDSPKRTKRRKSVKSSAQSGGGFSGKLSHRDCDSLEQKIWNSLGADSKYQAIHSGLVAVPDTVENVSLSQSWSCRYIPSALDAIGDAASIPGLNKSGVEFGSFGSVCCWQQNDCGLPALFYLHLGSAPRVWYIVSERHSGQIRRVFRRCFVSEGAHCADDGVCHKRFLVAPDVLLQESIPVSRYVQQPGDSLFLDTGSWFACLNLGFNGVESISYASRSWASYYLASSNADSPSLSSADGVAHESLRCLGCLSLRRPVIDLHTLMLNCRSVKMREQKDTETLPDAKEPLQACVRDWSCVAVRRPEVTAFHVQSHEDAVEVLHTLLSASPGRTPRSAVAVTGVPLFLNCVTEFGVVSLKPSDLRTSEHFDKLSTLFNRAQPPLPVDRRGLLSTEMEDSNVLPRGRVAWRCPAPQCERIFDSWRALVGHKTSHGVEYAGVVWSPSMHMVQVTDSDRVYPMPAEQSHGATPQALEVADSSESKSSDQGEDTAKRLTREPRQRDVKFRKTLRSGTSDLAPRRNPGRVAPERHQS